MNERIKQLAGKAFDKAVPYTWHNLDHVEVEKVMKEFAELIVRECGILADQYNFEKNQSRIYPLKTTAYEFIKEHFGVEQ